MPRRQFQEAEAPGHDSFLDIVANIVGILIILVMVTGVRAKQWTAPPPMDNGVAAAAAALQKDQATEVSLRRQMASFVAKQRELDAEIRTQDQARMQLATAAAAIEKEMESRRGLLSSENQQAFQLRRELADAEASLSRTRNEIEFARQSEAPPTLVESYPTPLSKPVDDGEIHFQLKGGHVAFVPLTRLLDRFKEDAKRQIYKLKDLPEFSDTVGPDGGFRLRYTMARRNVSVETQLASGVGGIFAELSRWTLIPTDDQLGETTDAALADGSRFREVLGSYSPGTTIVTIWVYQDSFLDFTRLKKELFRMGFAAAGRPLPDGVPIGGSPLGTKSAAQ